MSAIRLARGVTGRDCIVKFEGCYHGHADALLVKAGSGALTMGVPSSAGVPAGCTASTLVARYNDLDSVRALFAERGEEIAAVIVEPVAGNMGVVPPRDGFLPGLREITEAYGSSSSTRSRRASACRSVQTLCGVDPGLTCLNRSSARACPSPRSAASAAWSSWPRSGRCTRRARSPAARWPWPRASPQWSFCGPGVRGGIVARTEARGRHQAARHRARRALARQPLRVLGFFTEDEVYDYPQRPVLKHRAVRVLLVASCAPRGIARASSRRCSCRPRTPTRISPTPSSASKRPWLECSPPAPAFFASPAIPQGRGGRSAVKNWKIPHLIRGHDGAWQTFQLSESFIPGICGEARRAFDQAKRRAIANGDHAMNSMYLQAK